MKTNQETIFALSSAFGKSAIATIRISGNLSYKSVDSISNNMPKKPNTAIFNEITKKHGEVVDQTITPRSAKG